MKYIFFSSLIFFGACKNDPVILPDEPEFSNKIKVKKQEIILPSADSAFLRNAKIARITYYKNKNDSGFIYRTQTDSSYIIHNNTFTNHHKRIALTTFNSYCYFFSHGDSLYNYNIATNIIKPFLKESTADSNTLYPMPSTNAYGSIFPDGVLAKENGKFVLVYNYYWNKSKAPNFIDSSPLMVITDSNQYRKIGRFPAIFYKEEVGSHETYFTVDGLDNIFYIHPCFDSIYKINTNGEELCRGILHQYPKRDKYAPPQKGDLAYKRNYLMTNEKNLNVSICQEKYVVVVKQLASKEVISEQRYKIFIFNTHLEKLYVEEFPFAIIPKAFPNNNGFLIFSADFKKNFRYELP
jgi:hypothetical protein